MSDGTEKFIAEIEKSLASKTFVKLSLGNYKGSDKSLQKILVRPVTTKKGERLYFTYRRDTSDTAKNYDERESIERLREAFDGGFRSGHLFTSERDFQLTLSKAGENRIKSGAATFKARQADTHDKQKKTFVDRSAFYLKALGITNDADQILAPSQGKWRQINKFVEVLATLVETSGLNDRKRLQIVDMGSGNGYLTFAAYDYFANVLGRDLEMIGVETREKLVDKCSEIAAASEFEGLRFVRGTIADYRFDTVDILIALHACNTATDDALYKGIAASAALIVAAPCCHQELRPQMKPPEPFRDVLKHGTLMERTAETVTDGIRSLLLEREGYSTKLFEFVSTEHTAKNTMLVATRKLRAKSPEIFQEQVDAIKSLFSIREQHLEKLLGDSYAIKSKIG